MLKALHINRFRSCQDVRLVSLSEMTALVGRNGAGKTNILQAFVWLARVITGESKGLDYLDREPGKMSAEFELDGVAYRYSVSRSVNYQSSPDKSLYEPSRVLEEELSRFVKSHEEVLIARLGEKVELRSGEMSLLVSDETSAVFSLLALLPKTDPLRAILLRIWGFFGSVNYYSLSDASPLEDTALILAEDFKKWISGGSREKVTEAASTVMRIIKLSIDDPGTLDELKSILGEDQLNLVSGIKVTAFPTRSDESESEPSNNDTYAYLVSFKPFGHTRSFHFGQLSFGTKRIVQLVASMLADRTSIALIEQPEDGIHPALLHKLIPLLRAYTTENQVIFASHAPAVLNRMEPSEIRLVEIANGRTYSRSLSELEMGAAQNYLAREGPLADFVESL
jgi:predicted ATPase